MEKIQGNFLTRIINGYSVLLFFYRPVRNMSLEGLINFVTSIKRQRRNLVMGMIPDGYRGESTNKPALGDAPNEKKSCHLDESPIYILKVTFGKQKLITQLHIKTCCHR